MRNHVVESRPVQRPPMRLNMYLALPILAATGFALWMAYRFIDWFSRNIGPFWAAHWGLIVTVGSVVLLGVCASPIWKAFKTFSLHKQEVKDREADRELKRATTQLLQLSMERGFHAEILNSRTGDMLKVTNPYIESGTPRTKVQEIDAPQGQVLIAGPTVPTPPLFAEIEPLITEDRMVLCVTQEGPVYGTVVDLLSMCVVGKPGRGKSTALLYYILVLLMAGAEVWVWDPHSGLNELSYGLNYRDDLMDIENSVPVLHAELDERRQLWKTKKQTKHPLLLLVDEMPVIADFEMQRMKEVKKEAKGHKGDDDVLDEAEYYRVFSPSRLLKRFVLEARKWNCYVILSGQALPAEVLSTLTRENMSSRIVFESCNMHARMAGLQKEEIDKLMPMLKGAGPGVAVMDVSRWSKPALVAIPNTTPDDLRAFIDARGGSGNAAGEVWEWDIEHDEEEEVTSPQKNTPLPVRATRSTVITGELVGNAFNAPEMPFPESRESAGEVPRIPQEERLQIITIARAQMKQFGKVKRGEIPALLGQNNRYYSVVKQVLNEEGL